MSYVNYQILGHELTTVQVETGAADVKTYTFPVSVEVLAFGVMITEDLVDHSVDSAWSIDLLDSIGGTRTEKAVLTLNGADTTIKAGDGTTAAKTAIAADTDLDNGDVVFADRDNFPFEVLPGQSIVLEHKTASGTAGGAASMFALIRVGGERSQLARVWLQVD